MAELRSVPRRAGSSPPSPELDLPPDGVHGLGQTFVGFQGDGAVGHGPGFEAAARSTRRAPPLPGGWGCSRCGSPSGPGGRGLERRRPGPYRPGTSHSCRSRTACCKRQDGLGVIAVDLGVGAAAELVEAAGCRWWGRWSAPWGRRRRRGSGSTAAAMSGRPMPPTRLMVLVK